MKILLCEYIMKMKYNVCSLCKVQKLSRKLPEGVRIGGLDAMPPQGWLYDGTSKTFLCELCQKPN
jgi:hypothetical protein